MQAQREPESLTFCGLGKRSRVRAGTSLLCSAGTSRSCCWAPPSWGSSSQNISCSVETRGAFGLKSILRTHSLHAQKHISGLTALGMRVMQERAASLRKRQEYLTGPGGWDVLFALALIPQSQRGVLAFLQQILPPQLILLLIPALQSSLTLFALVLNLAVLP